VDDPVPLYVQSKELKVKGWWSRLQLHASNWLQTNASRDRNTFTRSDS